MGLITWIKAVWNRLFRKEIEERFQADIQLSSVMEAAINKYYNITAGKPPWLDPEDDIESINFAGYIDDVTAGLVTLDLGIDISGGERAEYLQKQADYVLSVITDKVSEALGNCGMMFKPNDQNVDYIEPGNFAPTETDSNGNILGCVFQSQIDRGDWRYTRLEWHRFEDTTSDVGEPERVYRITNYAYKTRSGRFNASQMSIGDPCSLTEVKEWANIEPDISLLNVEMPLFAYFKNPAPNRIDRTSPLGVPVWHNALKELKDLDISWSRKSSEVEDSKHMTFVPQSVIKYADQHEVKLPRFVRGLEMGVDADSTVHEHVSTLLTEQRIKDINSILAMISTKCGFSQGMFVLDEKTGMMTATQVEADDQESIRTIKNIRDALQDTITQLLYGCNVMADLYSDTPPELWETLKEGMSFSFGDITYNYQEDMANWWKYRLQGDVPPWMYYVKFEKMSEEEAKKMIEEAQPNEETLYDRFQEE